MFQPFRSLRFRLVLAFILVVGVLNAVLGGAAILLRDWQLRTRLDDRLAQQADRLALWCQARLSEGAEPAGIMDNPGRPYRDEMLYVTLHDEDREQIAATRNVRAIVLAPPRGQPVSTLEDDQVRELQGSPRRVRVMERPLRAGDRGYTLYVAADLAEVDEMLGYVWNLVGIGLPMALAVAGLAGWIVVSGAMRDLQRVSQTASHITPTHLDERISVTSSDAEITRLVTELNRMLDRLSGSFKAQQRFIASASHALQTPVAALLSQAQVLNVSTASEADCRKFVASVEEEMRQLTRMLTGMLSLIRIESGEPQRAQRVLSLNDVVVAAVEEVRPSAEGRGVTLQLTLPHPDQYPRDPDMLGDAELLQTMAENLLRHAVRNSPRGAAVDVALDLDDDQAVLTVSDAGPTLADAALRDAFARHTDGGTPAGSRSWEALALSLAKTVAELHDGTIGVRNRPEGGAAFFIWLPLTSKPAL